MMSDCKHDFDSDEKSNYCAKGCGETWALWTIKNLTEQVKMLDEQLEKAEDCLRFYADESCNEDWCERYLPEHDLAIIDYLSGKKARNYFKEKEGNQ